MWSGEEDLDGAGASTGTSTGHAASVGGARDPLWSVQGVWTLLQAASLGDAKLAVQLARKEADLCTLVSDAAAVAQPSTNPSVQNKERDATPHVPLTAPEYAELSVQAGIVATELWVRLGCEAMASLQCRRTVRLFGLTAPIDELATLCCRLALLTVEREFAEVDGARRGGASSGDGRSQVRTPGQSWEQSEGRVREEEVEQKWKRRAAACLAAAELLRRTHHVLLLKLGGRGYSRDTQRDSGSEPLLPVFVANALETARTAVGVYAALTSAVDADEASREGNSGGGYDRALRLAVQLVRLTSPSGHVETDNAHVPAVVANPAQASACLLLARVQCGAGEGSAARRTLDLLEAAATAGDHPQYSYQAAAMRAAIAAVGERDGDEERDGGRGGERVGGRGGERGGEKGRGHSPRSIALPEQLRLLTTARKYHYPTVEKILCESTHGGCS